MMWGGFGNSDLRKTSLVNFACKMNNRVLADPPRRQP